MGDLGMDDVESVVLGYQVKFYQDVLESDYMVGELVEEEGGYQDADRAGYNFVVLSTSLSLSQEGQ